MNRRDFAKALAAMPFVGAVPSFASICNSTCPSKPHSLWVVLEGPFAVVVDSSTQAITAFTPRDNGEHLFAFNGAVYDNTPAYTFEMKIANWPRPTLCVQNDSSPFCAENTKWDDTKDYFITINLPAPNRIIVYDSRFNAYMQDNPATTAPLPYSHVMEYDLNGKNLTMTGSRSNSPNKFPLTPLNGSAPDQLFRFEVGLINTLGEDSDPDGSKAAGFYNKFLLPRFPKLTTQAARKIGQVHKFHPSKAAKSHRHPWHPFTTTTFECKSGGLLVTSP